MNFGFQPRCLAFCFEAGGDDSSGLFFFCRGVSAHYISLCQIKLQKRTISAATKCFCRNCKKFLRVVSTETVSAETNSFCRNCKSFCGPSPQTQKQLKFLRVVSTETQTETVSAETTSFCRNCKSFCVPFPQKQKPFLLKQPVSAETVKVSTGRFHRHGQFVQKRTLRFPIYQFFFIFQRIKKTTTETNKLGIILQNKPNFRTLNINKARLFRMSYGRYP